MAVNTRESVPNPEANYVVSRVKRSLWGGSYIGVMGIDKTSSGPSDSYTRLVFWRDLNSDRLCCANQIAGYLFGANKLGSWPWL